MRRVSEIVGARKGRRLIGMYRDERGQSFVMVALMLTALLGFVGIVIDVGWYEVNLVRVQRAADAAALAGVVYLPGQVSVGRAAALAEAKKNGYDDALPNITVTADPDAVNTKILLTSVTAPVKTFFAQLFGVTSFTASRRARAEFILPVPMGSPQAWFGVNVLCRNSDVAPGCPAVPSAVGVGTLPSQGFWGAVETKGATRGNGDAYSTFYNASGPGGLNTAFDPLGYSYIVEFAPGTVNGDVWIYDPLFCPTGRKVLPGAQNRLGTGDVWFTGGGTPGAVTTEFKLWNMNGTPYSTADDTLEATDGGIFSGMDDIDKSAAYRGDQQYGGGVNSGNAVNFGDCAASPYHNGWWRLANNLAEGDYRLQIVTSSGGTAPDGLNAWGIQATSSSGPSARVYGQSRMALTMNVASGTSIFYLAQIEAAHAGKVLEIKLFDAGDISNTTLRILQPTATGYTPATFNWTSTGWAGPPPSQTSGGPVTSLLTSGNCAGCGYFQNHWLTLSIPLPTSYNAPTPSGPPAEPGPGWWKIQYSTGASGLEVTTWEVNIRGNPVHLVIP